jgi:hypothetical protein
MGWRVLRWEYNGLRAFLWPELEPNIMTNAAEVIGLLFSCSSCMAVDKVPETQPAKQVIQMHLQHRPIEGQGHDNLGYGTCQWLYPFDGPPEKLLAQPKYKSAKPVFYAARFGDTQDKTFTMVIDEGGETGGGYNLLYVDKNNDNRIDSDKERIPFQLGTTRGSPPLRIELNITTAGKTVTHSFSFSSFPYKDKDNPVERIHANLRNGSCYSGQAVIEGKPRKIAVADLNSNGLFNDVEKSVFSGDRFFVDMPDRTKERPSGGNMQSFPYGQYTRINDSWYSIAATPDGSQIEISQAQPALGIVTAAKPICEITLWSESQKQTLDLSTGSTRGLVGSYEVLNVRLRDKDAKGDVWELEGYFPFNAPKITVQKGEETRIAAGLPLRVEIQPAKASDGHSIEFKTMITGSSGGEYRWRLMKSSEPKAGFEIQDKAGKVILSHSFEFG